MTLASMPAATSAKRPLPQPASTTSRPASCSLDQLVSPTNRWYEHRAPLALSSCTWENRFHCKPNELVYPSAPTNRGIPSLMGYCLPVSSDRRLPSQISPSRATGERSSSGASVSGSHRMSSNSLFIAAPPEEVLPHPALEGL